jgi:hypothetical protein
MAMEGVALGCIHMEVGWGEWASQVEHSSRHQVHVEESKADWMTGIRPYVRVPQFELRFVWDMAISQCMHIHTCIFIRVPWHTITPPYRTHIARKPQFELRNAHEWTYTVHPSMQPTPVYCT